MFDGKVVLITGATGSFGKKFVEHLLTNRNPRKVILLSRDELKQFEMQNDFNSTKLQFVLGDVRDFSRVTEIFKNVDIVIHAAAMKQIPAAEKNPMEAIKTNILGADNIIRAAKINGVERVVALSSDKAANPANLYGATKLCSDRLFLSANTSESKPLTNFSVVRYGNVLGSRGSLIPFLQESAKSGKLPITDFRMTRFWLTLNQAIQLVEKALNSKNGSEIFVPKIPSFKVVDVARIVAPDIPLVEVGIRPGEKLHETMITEDDSNYTFEYQDYYTIVYPDQISNYVTDAQKVQEGFCYRSDTNSNWFSDESFREILVNAGLI